MTTCGSGSPVILMHGGLGRGGNWCRQVLALVDSGRAKGNTTPMTAHLPTRELQVAPQSLRCVPAHLALDLLMLSRPDWHRRCQHPHPLPCQLLHFVAPIRWLHFDLEQVAPSENQRCCRDRCLVYSQQLRYAADRRQRNLRRIWPVQAHQHRELAVRQPRWFKSQVKPPRHRSRRSLQMQA
jgi:hypothetical protein